MHKGSEVSRLSSQVRHIAETFSDCCAEKQQVIEELHNVKDELREMGE
jgi:CHAD domain-containing protein